MSSSLSIEKWTKIASAAPKFKEIIEKQSIDYSLDLGLYSEPGAPDYSLRVGSCIQMLRESIFFKSDIIQTLKNIDGESLLKAETLDYEKEYENRKTNNLISVKKNNSFIKAELDFSCTKFIH